MLKDIIKKIEKNGTLSRNSFHKRDINTLLDLREEAEFDTEWMRVYNMLKQKEVNDIYKDDINTICEKAYLAAYELSNSSDIAGYISDDFELISKAYIVGLNDEWLNALIRSYTEDEFPCGRLKLENCDRDEVYKNLIK